MYQWTNLLLPERLQSYGLTYESWERIAALGDKDVELKKQLEGLIKKIFG